MIEWISVYPSSGLLTSSENDEIELYSLTQMNPRNVTGFMEEYMQYAIVIKLKKHAKIMFRDTYLCGKLITKARE